MKEMGAVGLLLFSPLLALTAHAAEWAPCGGPQDKLWAWMWSDDGANIEYTPLSNGRGRTVFMADLSGNGHHYFNDDESDSKKPGFEIGVDKSGDGWAYTDPRAPLWRNSWNDGGALQGSWMNSHHTFSASGPFYLVLAGLNTRNGGRRDMWGIDGDSLIRLRSDDNRVDITVNGSRSPLADSDSIPKGPMLLEIWRDANNVMHLWVNGEDVGSNPTVVGTFVSKGFGYKRDGTSHYDDYLFELVTCDGLPTSAQRAEVREYLREKWHLFSATGNPPVAPPPAPPAPPTDLMTH